MRRVVEEALERFAAPDAAQALLAHALVVSDESELPEDPSRMAAFITGPLYEAVALRIGREEADFLLVDLAPLIERASSSVRSGIRRVRGVTGRRVLLVATRDADAVRRLERVAEDFEVRAVDDVFALLQGMETFQDDDLTVVIDGRLPTVQPGTMVALSRVLPLGASVVLWGVVGVGHLAGTEGWHRLPEGASELLVVTVAEGKNLREMETLPPPPEEETGPASVVVADDDPAFRATLARLLRTRGYDVRTAPDGYSALNLCMHKCPDLVVSDRDMPVVDGGQLARLLREMLRELAPPVIIVTSRPDQSIPGASLVLAKSDAQGELLDVVERVLSRQRRS